MARVGVVMWETEEQTAAGEVLTNACLWVAVNRRCITIINGVFGLGVQR